MAKKGRQIAGATESGRPMTAPEVPELYTGKPADFAEMAPPMTPQVLEGLNGMFRAFIFRRSKTWEFWTTCCRKHVKLDEERTVTPQMRAVFDTNNSPEERYHWGCSAGWTLRNPAAKERVQCPICGRKAQVKELAHTGKRHNLTEYCRAAALSWHKGALWAVCYQASKSYAAESPLDGLDRLTLLPSWTATAVIRFRPGAVEMTKRDWWYRGGDWQSLTVQRLAQTNGKPFPAGDPFTYCNDYGMSYGMIGWEEIDKSPFRYIGIRKIKEKTGEEPLRLLTMASLFPRQMEMLHKFGLDIIIERYAAKGTKTAWLFDWAAEDPKRFCRLPVKTVIEGLGLERATDRQGAASTALMRSPGDLDRRLEGMRIWKTGKGRDSLEDCVWLACEFQKGETVSRVRARMKEWGVSLERVRNYLLRQQKKQQSVEDVEQRWTDYLDAAANLGLDLSNDVIRFPKNLNAAHDERTKAWAQIQKLKEEEKHKARTKILENKYAFALDGLRIVVPKTPQEIIDEGKKLKHCVGGYADRHFAGSTVILFLRREAAPKKPLVTVEMGGNQIRQAHGYDDDRTSCPDNPDRTPIKELYKDFFATWTDWLKRGSPRDKDGKPKVNTKNRGPKAPAPTERKAG